MRAASYVSESSVSRSFISTEARTRPSAFCEASRRQFQIENRIRTGVQHSSLVGACVEMNQMARAFQGRAVYSLVKARRRDRDSGLVLRLHTFWTTPQLL